MPKFMTAKDILRDKEYVAPKFDTTEFIRVVGEYFAKNDVKSKILLIPYRFIDIEWVKFDWSDEPMASVGCPYRLNLSDRDKCYRAELELDKWGRLDAAGSYTMSNYTRQEEAGILVPRIIIDKPYFENAAGMLRVMGGYVVEKKMKKRVKLYTVSLI